MNSSQIQGINILWVSLFSCFLAQFVKVFTSKEKRFDLSRIISSGGMPSSHSSFVTTLAILVGADCGFNSTEFSIVVVFALIIMYDATGVRRAVGKQATILNTLIEDIQLKRPIEHGKLKELVGHTPKEVLAGALLGVLVALIALI